MKRHDIRLAGCVGYAHDTQTKNSRVWIVVIKFIIII